MGKVKEVPRPLGSPQSWARTPGTYISAQSHIDGVDQLAHQMELRWGAGRLRLLVDTSLREKFDRQRYLLNQAIWHGDLEAVRRETSRMAAAWMALDRAAMAAHAPVMSPEVWEVRLKDGSVAAIVRDDANVEPILTSGRKLVVYRLSEIGRILSHHGAVTEAKLAFPGATVEAVRAIGDPLDAFADTAAGLDDEIQDDIPFFGA